MVALLVTVPEVSGAILTQELYSPHLDTHQRMLILETLATAAQQMANPRLRVKGSRSQTGTHQDRLTGSEAISRGISEGEPAFIIHLWTKEVVVERLAALSALLSILLQLHQKLH